MKNQILFKNLSVIFLSIAILSMLIIIVLQNHRLPYKNGKEENKITSIADVITPKTSSNSEPIAEEKHLQYEKTISKLKSQIKEITEQRNLLKDKNYLLIDEDKLNPQDYADNLRGLKNAMEDNPDNSKKSINEMNDNELKKTIINGVKINYASLFNDLRLSSEELEKLERLISDKMIAGIKASESLNTNSTIQDNKNEFLIEQENILSDYDMEIRNLLGDDNYKKYMIFIDSSEERLLFNNFKEYMINEGDLIISNEEDFIEALYKERQKIDTNNPDKSPNVFEFVQSLEAEREYINTKINKTKLINDKYLAVAEQFLSDEQLDNFEKFLKENVAVEKVLLGKAINLQKEIIKKSNSKENK
jgi:hypothetical protein